MMQDRGEITRALRNKAEELDFDLFGITPSGILSEDAVRFRDWIKLGFNGGMDYLARNIDKRMDPGHLLDNAKSVIVTGLNYYQQYSPASGSPAFSRYSLGDDYHDIIKGKLKTLTDYLKILTPGAQTKICVDSVPIKENVWAQRAGLGWIGRNSLLINREMGSYLFLGLVITTVELEYNNPFKKDHCGSCRKCIESCPNGAISGERTIDANKCISYLTIEHRGTFSDDSEINFDNRIFGCDLCQEVCPWNSKPEPTTIKEFLPGREIIEYTYNQWEGINEVEFNRVFNKSPVKRTGLEGFKRNLSKLI